MKELYTVHLIVNDFPHGVHFYDGVRMRVFRDPDDVGPEYSEEEYRAMIRDYDLIPKERPEDAQGEDPLCGKEFIKGDLFTKEEVEEMRAFFEDKYDVEFVAERFTGFPIEAHFLPKAYWAVGGSEGFSPIYMLKGYPLKFKVQGYFDVYGLEPTRFNEKKHRAAVRRLRKSFQEFDLPPDRKDIACGIKGCTNPAVKWTQLVMYRDALGLGAHEMGSFYIKPIALCLDHSVKRNPRNLDRILTESAAQLKARNEQWKKECKEKQRVN